jgi:hypothetical protein
MKTTDKFACFILTHGRPDNVKTFNTLRKQGYTGDIYLIVDNEDSTLKAYQKQYGDKVIVFDKAAIAQTLDECDNFNIGRKSVVYARNACFDIARELGIRYFLQLDDDYNHFEYRFTPDLKPSYYHAENLDRLFTIVLDYYKSIPALTIALAQGGDMIGGAESTSIKTLNLKRKAMNTFFCSIDRPFQFVGRINEDVNTYVALGNRGNLIFTIYNASIVQTPTQSQSGGMSDIYHDTGTYIKSFYTVMNSPSCVIVYEMGDTVRRMHHRINWKAAVPVIISERHRKPGNHDHT